MGRLSVLLDKERLNASAYLTEDNIKNLNSFLLENKNSLDSSYVDMLSKFLVQMNGYFNQLLVKSEGLTNNTEQYKTKAKELESRANTNTKENLEEVIKEYFSLYSDVSNNISETLTHNDEKKEQATLVSSVNDLLTKIDQAYVETDTNIDNTLLPIVDMYKKAMALNGKDQIATLTLLLDEEKRILAKDKENKAIEEAMVKEKIFDLFAKINDQIIDKEFKKVNDLIYARYKLEDGKYYYAVIPDGNKVITEDKEFKTFSSFEMNRVSVAENLNLILKNIMIYYDINEYTRYVEAIYKKQMTKEIDNAIGQYKTRLSTMEEIIKSQLTFMDDVAPILNKKTSPKYPDIVYNDIPVKEFYPTELSNSLIDDAKMEQNKLMVKLADDTVPNNINTKEVLTAIYGGKITNDLINTFKEPVLDETANKPVVIENSVTTPTINETPITTNYQKISDYIKTRENELNKISSGDTNITITKDDNPIYQNINTIFDLNTAALISDKQYNEGQGNYAISEYLKTGEANRFTSSSNARNLASGVKPNAYTALLLENMIKEFAGSGKKSSEDATYLDRMQQILLFVKEELSKETFSATEMREKLLNNDNLLNTSIKNFDYEYLDPTSENTVLFDQAIETGVNNNNPSAIRIKQALTDIKTLAKSPLETIKQTNQTLAA